MRIPKSWVRFIAKQIVDAILNKSLVESTVPINTLIEETEKLILEELMVEDKLNEEVRQLLKKYESDIEKGRLDYRKLFEITKRRLVKERNIIL